METMIHFDSDYMRGGCPQVMERLVATNMEQTVGYGLDPYTRRAEELILQECGIPQAKDTLSKDSSDGNGHPGGRVFLLVGGTQTNATVIDGVLRRNQGVIAAESGHINVHEAGAIESGGHKVLALPCPDGKLSAAQVDTFIRDFYADETWPHMVAPGMVYITQPTEFGGLYTREELKALHEVCAAHDIPLYIDGARLAYALAASDITLQEMASLADIFYIGGTKCGALFGEAVVTRRPELLPNFFTVIKQHGALLSKGRLLGVQFEALFTDGLYKRLGAHAVRMAMMLREVFLEKGYSLYMDSPTNQQFILLPNEVIDDLGREVTFELWGPRRERITPVRFVTDWGTQEADIRRLSELLPANPL